MAKLSIEREIGKARSHERSGAFDQALRHYQSVLKQFPGNVRAQQGVARLGNGRPAMAGAKSTAPPRAAEAEEALRLFNAGRYEQALRRTGQLLAAHPGSAMLWNLEGTIRAAMADHERAEAAFRRVIELKPADAGAYNNLGIVLTRKGEPAAALASLNKAIALKPDYAEAHNSLGNAHLALGDAEAATDSYRRAIACKGDMAQAHINLGHALHQSGMLDAAIASFSNGIRLSPANQPENQDALIHLRQWVCDWSLYDEEYEATVASLGLDGQAIPPFNALAMEDNAAHQLKRSVNWARKKDRADPAPAPMRWPARLDEASSKIRVGYFSADFHDHATIHLLAGLLREHDRSRFEIYLYHYGEHDMGKWREPLTACADIVREARALPDGKLVEQARADNLDIAIDLKGYTKGNRSQIFARRIAPVQMNFLGYPGSMGAPFIDYIIADRLVIPDVQREHYSEKVIRLPGSYQPNDDQRAIAETKTDRADFGLPETSMVFCCFNQTYKISSREFDIWMRVLQKTPDSVLWLLRSNAWAEDNLRREAEKRGVAGDRLVFADKLPHELHLARHKHADLFLDTFNVNAHTTASDALWAGLPVVTKAGEQFAARVAASLLHAVGLEGLVTESEDEYEAKILELAGVAETLQAVKSKLAENRLTHALFDTKRFARNFEAALTAAHERQSRGLAADDLDISEAAGER